MRIRVLKSPPSGYFVIEQMTFPARKDDILDISAIDSPDLTELLSDDWVEIVRDSEPDENA